MNKLPTIKKLAQQQQDCDDLDLIKQFAKGIEDIVDSDMINITALSEVLTDLGYSVRKVSESLDTGQKGALMADLDNVQACLEDISKSLQKVNGGAE